MQLTRDLFIICYYNVPPMEKTGMRMFSLLETIILLLKFMKKLWFLAVDVKNDKCE